MKKAALYLRSSKDRSDVSIDAQKRELTELAKRKNILIVEEYADVVESAKDEDRPDFQRLLYDLKSGRRNWDTLLVTDTSRLSRRQYMAHVFDHECKKRGISLIFSKLPESDPVTDMVLKGVMRVFDELHSEMSRQKGLAGMAENIRQGFRAGGKAPRGYQLKKIETGAIRDGEPVTKTRLVPSSEAPKIKKYLKARLNGASRSTANTDNLPTSSLVELEWNAFTYAGCSVWNMRYPKAENRKRRPRNEWVIEEDTHEALINMQEADQLVSQLEQSKRNRRVSKYLLSGIIETPTGKAWHGCRTRGKSNYRTDGKYVAAETLEKAITQKIKNDALSDEFIKELTAACHKQYSSPQHNTRPHRQRIEAIEEKISKMLDMAMEMSEKGPVLRKIESLEQDKSNIEHELKELEAENRTIQAAGSITEDEVRKLVEISDDMEELIPSLVERIILNPKTLQCEIHYSVKLASPRGFEPLLPP